MDSLNRAAIDALREEGRVKTVSRLVQEIYKCAVATIKEGLMESYTHRLGITVLQGSLTFYEMNKHEIIQKLKELFPDCAVYYLGDICNPSFTVNWSWTAPAPSQPAIKVDRVTP